MRTDNETKTEREVNSRRRKAKKTKENLRIGIGKGKRSTGDKGTEKLEFPTSITYVEQISN